MRTLTWLTGAALAFAAIAAAAQSVPQSHEQHQATAQHQAPGKPQADSSAKCCCEEMMHKMMMEMMQKHQGMGMAPPTDSPQPDKDHEH